jgi:RNA polymerase sigma factor (sigma-70 family)
MSEARLGVLVEQLRRAAGPSASEQRSDRDLLHAYAAGQDEDAFAALVRRHGPLVWHVCRRALPTPQDAEDAFQATFLVLAQKAPSGGWRESVAPWLYAVARRAASKLRSRLARQGPAGPERAAPDPLQEMTARELLATLDEEVAALPKAQRGPVLLCLLEGHTQEEAARLLGTPLITLRRRLDAGKKALQARLTRRGVAPSAALGALAFARLPAAPVPALAAGARAAALAEGVLVPARSRGLLALLLALAALGGVGLAACRFLTGAAPPPGGGTTARAAAPADPLPPGAVLRLGSARFRHRGQVGSLAYSASGKLLASGGWGNPFVALWDPETGRERLAARVSRVGVNDLAFSPDGQLLAAAGRDGVAYLWDAATGKPRLELKGYRGEVKALAFSARGDALAVAAGTEVRLYDPSKGRVQKTFEAKPGWVSGVALSPDGRVVAAVASALPAALNEHTVHLWDRDTGKRLHELRGHRGPVLHVAFSRDGRVLATTGQDQTLLWEVASGKPRGPLGGGSRAALSSDGKLLAVAGYGGAVRLWELGTGKQVGKLPANANMVLALAFSPDGKALASANGGSVIHLRDLSTGRPRLPLEGHEELISSVAWSPDGRAAATHSWDGTVRLWDAGTGKELRRLNVRGGDGADIALPRSVLAAVSFSPDGKLVAATRGDEAVLLWDVRTGKQAGRYPGERFAFSPDGKWIACSGRGRAVAVNRGVLHLYDRATGTKVRELWGHHTPISWLTFSHDSRTLISAGLAFWSDTAGRETSFLRVWDVATGEERRGLSAEATRMRSLWGFSTEATQVQALSPDGRTWASTTRRGETIKLGEVATGGWRGDLSGHAEHVYAVAFSPDGRLLASASMDGTVRLWELPDGKEVARLEGHRGWVLSVAFSPDGRRLLSGGADATALVWDVSRFAARARPPASLTAAELERCWVDLGGDARAAYRAAARLLSSPGAAAGLLGARLRPAAGVDGNRLDRLIAELGSDQFAARERATEELAKLGELAEPALRKALGGERDLEVKRRIRRLLDASGKGKLTPETTRQVRAAEVLEWLGAAEPRRLLEALAKGAPEAPLTREAGAALERLRKRPP